MMDSERIKLENYNGVLYCDVCINEEFTLSDLEAIRDEIRKNFSSSTDVICKESGCFSVAANVQKMLWKGIDEFLNVIYVAENQSKRNNAKYAAETYMRKYNTRVAGTKEAAFAMLSDTRITA
jgi:uncharacterized protein YuzB (UPF0349 family)